MKAFTTKCGMLGIAVALAVAPAAAEDHLKVAIGQINNWENRAPTLGQDAGIFKKHGLVLENVGTQGAGETIQAVIPAPPISRRRRRCRRMRAFSKGAPVRSGARIHRHGDLYRYVKAVRKSTV